MDMKVCQSCAMPLNDEKLYGTNKDGSKNEEYCVHCYKEGEFTSQVTMEQMIEICVPFMVQEGMDEDKAREIMKTTIPKLKRWAH